MNLNLGSPYALAAPAISWAEMVAHRNFLVRFAQRKLRDPMLAEDVVHDVFEAVLSGRAAFGGRAALRSWLTGVLKHKIVDLVRRRSRFDSLDSKDAHDESSADDAALGLVCPQPRPDEVAEQRELLDRALAHIDALPAPLRDAMQLRVLEDNPTEAVCSQLGISEENLFVRIHRARRQLLGGGHSRCAEVRLS